ncbi:MULTISPECIES: hypothetical protein [unclassified Pseudomonas]|jgi:hypothetical protein|uniref:hypothetical protein n=1 Tax=unclassified Pseudomonas TaxID=196821 RepID=UPI001431EAF7|nr:MULTISPECIES: hypothetical protein [unclassified Pseudomonas]MDY0834987.1 hypothetical protein [Pseudomonas sp. SED1]NIL20885.1 hypothetical protein [Pseudomonas sp. AN3A02]
MTTFTVFFCGTGSNQFDDTNANYWNGELVSTLAQNTRSQSNEFANWIIIDGPGSGNLQADDMFTKPGGYYQLRGMAFGSGWEENVSHAVNMMKGNFTWQREELSQENYNKLLNEGIPIEEVNTTGCWFWRTYKYGTRQTTPQQLQEQIIKIFRKDGVIPTQVNLVGWSRGGISCHMLANAMLKDNALSSVPVNIFAADPVPGALNFQDNRVKIGINVKEYVAFYARDERSLGFSSVVPEFDSGTRVHIYPIPGRHATLVGNAAPNGNSGAKVYPEPGQIVRHFAEVCLSRWGVPLEKKLNLTPAKINELLTKIKNDFSGYVAMRSTVYTTSTQTAGERTITKGSRDINFSAVRSTSYTPEEGLSIEHILTNDYFKDIN